MHRQWDALFDESVVIAGQSSFLHLAVTNLNIRQQLKVLIKYFILSDTTDTQNPIPYIFGSTEELQEYLDLASKETFETFTIRLRQSTRNMSTQKNTTL